MLSILVNHWNRSYTVDPDGSLRPLFRRAFGALFRAVRATKTHAELVVVDWPDQDSPRLGLGPWLRSTPILPVTVVRGRGTFSRGAGRNQAAAHSDGDVLYFMDADMLTPPAVLRRGLRVVAQGQAFFPLYMRELRDGTYKAGNGTGNAVVSREHFLASGGFPAAPEWGGEDTAFARWFNARGLCVREMVPGFIHQRHARETTSHGL